jgi:indolepyruvate ferredoxin oxidoreductase
MREVSLDDIYRLDRGQVYMTGIQALVRLAMVQRRRDQAAGLDTGGLISGYRGSPLGGLDSALWKAQPYLDELDIRFLPAINEEMAATAIIGTQQLNIYPDAARDGVFGIWYGKGPGLDRASDALKHANSIGTSPLGGVLVVAGDDHGAVSSALAHQSEQLMASWMMPVLNPASIREYIEYGLLGLAMSRFSGCYVGFKAISDTVETAGSVLLDATRPVIRLPEDFSPPPGGLHARWPDPRVEAEARLQNHRLPAAQAFARANNIDRVVFGADHPRFGIITTGKAHLDLMQALVILGISEEQAKSMGLAVYKVGMSWPLETERACAFAGGLDEVLVVEEKRSLIEAQLKDALYHMPADQRPLVLGKRDENGAPLLPGAGEVNPEMIARLLARRLQVNGILGEIPPGLEAGEQRADSDPLAATSGADGPIAVRTPFFCSGCPHNRSTMVPEGSRAFAGTGCHLMVVAMERDTSSFLHMGGEGVNWVGQAPFSNTSHVFQNLGDGTYIHSGSLAIRQAVAAGTNITYKILFNDAVAMTGGQPVEGAPSVARITNQVHHEGVQRIAVVSDAPAKYGRDEGFAPGTTIHHRDALAAVEIEMREIPGVSVIVYDQTCAAELRRRRKRGLAPDPARRVFINEAVCEGCGDCSRQSNCMSIIPKETRLGRKRAIDQWSCNKDFSCLDGLCPSFVTVTGGALAKAPSADQGRLDEAASALPAPTIKAIGKAYGILITGIGGTGVITVGQLIGMAAHLDGHGCSVLDFTGLAQKGGGVLSCVRLAEEPGDITCSRLPRGGADLLLAGDLVVAMGAEALECLAEGTTSIVANAEVAPTAANVLDGDAVLDATRMQQLLVDAVGSENAAFVAASALVRRLTGDSIMANIFLLGHAWQQGSVPVSHEAMMRAIELNGVSVDDNKRSFAYGRLAAHDPALVAKAAGMAAGMEADADREAPETVDEIIEYRADYLSAYQNAAFAGRYRGLVEAARRAEIAASGSSGGYSEAVARGLFRLMAIKDEYEVARLYTDGSFAAQLGRQFSGDFRFKIHLAPPLFARRDPLTGRPRKSAYGQWILPALSLLASLKGLRGTAFDPFGYTAERRTERRNLEAYTRVIGELNAALSADNRDRAVEIAALPMQIRGFGAVRAAAANALEQTLSEAMAKNSSPRA